MTKADRQAGPLMRIPARKKADIRAQRVRRGDRNRVQMSKMVRAEKRKRGHTSWGGGR
jgi:hypothetical protein